MITVFGYLGTPSPALVDAAASATLVVGGRRHLDALNVPENKRVVLGPIAPAIEALQMLSPDEPGVVVASGDPLFCGVVRRIRQGGLSVRVVPEVGSLQAAFAAVALPWDDALLVSTHGNDPGPALLACAEHPKVGVLTDHRTGLPQIVAATTGLGRWYVLAERLGESDERVCVLNEAEALRVTDPAQPNVVLVLAHHPDEPAALGAQHGVAGGRLEVQPTGTPDSGEDRPSATDTPPVLGGIGQLTNSPAARTHADAIDAALGATRRYDGKAADHLAQAWAECDLIVSHLALGATTRLIAPLLADKVADPGVVVVDEAGQFVVPLVGGHVGGANELARRIADALGATAVITTATDATGIPGLDTLGWATSGDLAGVTRALLDGAHVELIREQPWPLPALPDNVREPGVARVERRGTHTTELPSLGSAVARIMVSDASPTPHSLPTVTLHPRSLVVGMGCNRGAPVETLDSLLSGALADARLERASIGALTSIDAKADEAGLVALAASLGVPFVTYAADELAAVAVPNPSDAPQLAVGTPSVAEASIIAHGANLLVDKRKNPDATIAIGRLTPMGTLAVVGLGPGADDLLTPRAREVLRASSVVVGYRPYVAQIRHLLRPGTEVLAIGMGTEELRIEFALEKAREGRSVSLVCGGDPAIYAMASPLLEKGTEGVAVQVVPGVTAELAASAILGAPLGHDHVTISLSDLHTDWQTIERRLQAAAEGDFVVALYNPRSKKRVRNLPRALEILAAHRPPATPVALVQDASRPAEHHRVAPLAEFDPAWVDMHSIVIVGSSTTRLVPTGRGESAMVTPRDYHWMPEDLVTAPPLVIAIHGTRVAEGHAVERAFVNRVRGLLPGVDVRDAYVELEAPTIADAVAAALRDHPRRPCIVVPLMLGVGSHVREDIPEAIAEGRARVPGSTVIQTLHLGPDPRLRAAVVERIGSVSGDWAPDSVGVLFLGRGCSVTEANADHARLARVVGEEGGYGMTVAAYIQVVRPTLSDGLDQLYAVGFRRLVVALNYMFAGRLQRWAGREASAWAERHPDADVRLADVIGDCDALAEVVADRYRTAPDHAGSPGSLP